MIILKALMCILILIVVPGLIGLFVTSFLRLEDRSLGLVFPVGYTVMLVIFELVTIPVLLTTQYGNFIYVECIYTPIIVLLCLMGIISCIKQAHGISNLKSYIWNLLSIYRTPQKLKKSIKIDTCIAWVIAGGILIFIFVMLETNVIFDGDDAYYVVQSLITQQNGSMYVTQPYTGGASPIDIRHAMAVFTMWITYVGEATGIHTTILCHSVLPLVLIPLTLITYSEIGVRLLKGKEDMLPFFVIFAELLILFGRVSLYTSEAFLLARTWQGKSLAANLLIPMVLLSLFLLYRKAGSGAWILLIFTNAVGGIFSSLAVMIASILMVAGGAWYGLYTRRIKNMIYVWLCCIPGAIYMMLYAYFTYVSWK